MTRVALPLTDCTGNQFMLFDPDGVRVTLDVITSLHFDSALLGKGDLDLAFTNLFDHLDRIGVESVDVISRRRLNGFVGPGVYGEHSYVGRIVRTGSGEVEMHRDFDLDLTDIIKADTAPMWR